MPEYRRNGTREFFKITDKGEVIRVLNKQSHSLIDIIKNQNLVDETRVEAEPCTEEEFLTAHKNAIARVSLMRLDV